MLTVFRSNQLLFSFFLLFYAGFLHIAVFVNPVEWQPMGHGVLSGWVYDLVGTTGVLPDAIAILLLFIQGIFVNILIANHRLADSVTNLPGVFYILIASAIPDFLHLSPQHLANTFYLIALAQLLKVYKNPSCPDVIFNVGFWAAVGSLFYPSYIIFLVFGLVGLNSLRAFKIKEGLMLMVGGVVVYILAGTYFFWMDQFDLFLARQFYDNFAFFDFQKYSGNEVYFKIAFVDAFLIVAIFSYSLYVFKKIMEAQKKISILYWALFFGGLTVLFQANMQLDHLLVLAIPLGMLISMNFQKTSTQWAEALHFFILLIVLFFQYQQFILPS